MAEWRHCNLLSDSREGIAGQHAHIRTSITPCNAEDPVLFSPCLPSWGDRVGFRSELESSVESQGLRIHVDPHPHILRSKIKNSKN